MRVIMIFAALGLLALVLTIAAFPLLGHFGLPFSTSSSEWANFGTYLGGVAGPLLSFLALIAVAWTVRLQYDLLRRDLEKQTSDQHIRWLEAIYRDLLDVMSAPLRSAHGSEPTTTRAVLHREVDRAIADPAILKARLEELLKLLTQYCQAVALYRENVTEFFDTRIFLDRGARILDHLKPFLPVLGTNAAITIEFCDMHLRGQTERQNPEALRRNTRA
jgi:hypothetical protein